MSSSEKGQQASLLQSPSSHQPQCATTTTTGSSGPGNRRTAILLGVLAALTIVAVLAVSVAVLYASNSNNTKQGSGDKTESGAQLHQRSLQPQTNQQHIMARIGGMRGKRAIPTRVGPSSRPVPTITDGSCVSHKTESNIPAAHIKGHGIQRGKWIQGTGDSVVPGYEQRWQCNDVYVNDRHQMQEQAFVDGGVRFNQTDKSIYVPTCGYYMIYSQILFVMQQSPLTHSITVYHNLKIEHNCSWESDTGPIQLQAKASIAPHGSENHDGGISTTYTADVVHLCAGGRVWIEIPDGPNGVPCCPRGVDSGTFMGLILLANTPCSSWPPVITMTNEY